MSEPSALATALAEVQAHLPTIAKSETAKVATKTGGSYSYSYADLAAISKVVLPLLGAHGLSWITRPTLNEGGKFVLAYELLHVSGESRTGEYPLPAGGTAQEIGSAITYGRRYTLCSVTGVAPEADDDDGAAASRRRYDEPAAEPEPELATREQLANYRTLHAKVTAAMDDGSLRELWQLIPVEFKAEHLTTTHANELRGLITQRRNELVAVVDSAEAEPTAKWVSEQRKIFALLHAVKIDGDDARHKFATETLGRSIATFKTLTDEDHAKLTTALEGRKRAMGVKT